MSELTPEQSDAVELREIDVFCEAGAGTGKTRVLVERFVAAVCDDGVELDSMLAFTFTEPAAEQLRGRIRGALRARAREARRAGDEKRRLELKRLARDTEGAWISTIHGFCRRVIAAHPVAAGVDPRFRVVDAGEASRLQTRAFRSALDEILSGGDPEVASRVVAAATPRGLRTIVATSYDELRSRGDEEPRLPEIPPPDPAVAVAALAEAADAAFSECAGATGVAAPEMHRRLELASALSPSGPPSLDDVIPLELKSTAKPFTGAACDRYREAWKAARRALAETELGDSYELVRNLLGIYGRHYERLKRGRSGLDFEDLQLRALGLMSNPAVRESYSGRFRHVLVDEFQDTNQVQRDLVLALQGPETRLFCVGDELQSIFGFRHADLSVFRSERARFERMDDASGRVLPLTGNFRARPEVLAAVNAAGSSLLERFEPLTVGGAEQGERELSGGGTAVELLLTATDKKHDWSKEEVDLHLEDDEPAPAHRVAEARLLATRLQALHEAGVPRSKMVVLLRSRTWIESYERELDAAGLEPYVIGGPGYWSQQQVEDVLALLAVIANPLDDEAVLGALASPACGVTPDTLWLLHRVAADRADRARSPRYWHALREVVTDEVPEEAKGRRWAEAIDADELERLRLFQARAERLREEASVLGIEGTIDAACREFRYDLATLMRDRGQARWANVRKLMRLAREFESNEGADLRGFLAYAAEESARADEGEAPTVAEEHDGVRLMTVHGAKGLEFEVVAVPELGRRLLAGFRPAIRIGTIEPPDEADPDPDDGDTPSPLRIGLRLARLGRPSERLFDLDELAERAEADDAAEELRLAHVAATRAEGKLILSGTFSPGRKLDTELTVGAPVTERLIRALHETEFGELLATGGSGEVEIALDPPSPRPGLEASFEPGRLTVRLSFPEPGAGAEIAPALSSEEATVSPAPAEAPPLLDLPAAARSSARLSYSSLSLYGRCGYRFMVEKELGIGAGHAGGATLPQPAALDEGGPDPGDPVAEIEIDELLGPEELNGGSTDPSARARRFGFGNAVHRLLEWSGRGRWREPGRERCARVLCAEGLAGSDDEIDRAMAMIQGWLSSPLCDELLGEGVELRPEEPFLLLIDGALIRGSIDLVARLPGGATVVVDYKTDRLSGDAPIEQMERYEVQRSIYALAVASGEGPVRTAYSFLERAGEPVERTYDGKGLEAARAAVSGLLEGIASGRFEVTKNPHAALCGDCPARKHLCSYDEEMTLR